MFTLNWMAIGVCTIIMFVGGAVWHGPIFGKLWMRIHHGEKPMTAAELKAGEEGMWKLIVPEFISGFLMMVGLACIVHAIPQWSGAKVGAMIWLAFILPQITSTVIWGGDKKKYMWQKIVITGSYRLIIFMLAGYILSMWK